MIIEQDAAGVDRRAGARAAAARAVTDSIADGRRVSEILREIAETWPEERITLGDLLDLFGERGHGLLMLTLTLPNLVPLYLPGLSAITGLPIAAAALQMAFGMRHPWLPRILRRRSVAAADLRHVVRRAEPWLHPVERVLRPRLHGLTRGPAARGMAAVSVLLALLLSLPIPFTNMVFAAPLAAFSLGVVQRDGAAVAVAWAASMVAVAFVATASWTVIVGAVAWLGP